jgi:hypothetical protein
MAMAPDLIEGWHPLQSMLNLQLASDTSAVHHLAFVLDALSSDALLPSAHLQKWIARIQSLIHSRDPGAKWAGLVIALRTATLSKIIIIECAQSWIGMVQPILSVRHLHISTVILTHASFRGMSPFRS